MTTETIDTRFTAYITANPQVFDLFRRFAGEVRSRGFKKYSADAIVQRVRWHCTIETSSTDFKINDHFSSRLARMLIQHDPTFSGFFELRELRAKQQKESA